MALTNAERQKRWREKNRVIYNLRRRNARRFQGSESRAATGSGEEIRRLSNGGAAKAGDNPPPLNSRSKIEELRELVRVEQEKPRVEHPVKPLVYRSDYGAIISESAWNRLQQKKKKAKEGGYVLDEWSQ